MPQEILVTFPLDHTKPTKIEVNGVKGETCKSLTAGLEKALGETVKSEATEEFYEQPLKERDREHQSGW
jgi:hypothetical protein